MTPELPNVILALNVLALAYTAYLMCELFETIDLVVRGMAMLIQRNNELIGKINGYRRAEFLVEWQVQLILKQKENGRHET